MVDALGCGYINVILYGDDLARTAQNIRGIIEEGMPAHRIWERLPGHEVDVVLEPTLICFLEDECGSMNDFLHAFRVYPVADA